MAYYEDGREFSLVEDLCAYSTLTATRHINVQMLWGTSSMGRISAW